MSHKAKINTSTGHIHIEEAVMEEEDDDISDTQQSLTKPKTGTTISEDDRKYLCEIFFELSTEIPK